MAIASACCKPLTRLKCLPRWVIVESAMRVVVAFFCALVLAAVPGLAANKMAKVKPAAPFTKSEELLTWMNGYRLKPEPKRLPEAVKAMVKSSVTKDMDQAGVYIGFTAGVIGSSPDDAEKLIGEMFPLEPQDQVLLIKAIAYSGLSNWKGLMI